MSSRHQRTRSDRSTRLDRAPKHERKAEHRRVRHAAHTDLHVLDDPDAIVLERPHHTSGYRDPEPVDAAPARRRFRHWKQPFWKRRTAMRHERNRQIDELIATL